MLYACFSVVIVRGMTMRAKLILAAVLTFGVTTGALAEFQFSVPEPATTLLLVGLGLVVFAALGFAWRRRH